MTEDTGALRGDCRGCGCPVNDYRAHVWAERTCCPDCDHRPLPALRELIAERDQAVAAVERVEALADHWGGSYSPNWLAAYYALRRALDGTT